MSSVFPPRLSRWADDHQFEVDAMFALVVGVVTMAGFVLADIVGSERSADLYGGLLIVGQTVALAARRRAPIASLLAVCSFTAVFWVADYPTSSGVFSLLAVYAATAHGGSDRVRLWRIVGGVVAAMSVIAVAGVLSPGEDLPAAAVIGIAALHLTAAIAGEIVHERRERFVALEQRAVRAENERVLLARQAVLDERTRIARDLHDVVAHGMSVMVVQAGAAERIVATDPGGAAIALGHIQHVGREALSEMRRMLDVLRDGNRDNGGLAPQPTLNDLGQLVRHCTDSGIPTELVIEGDAPTMSAGHELAAYRVVQEALTNVIKHAGPSAHAVISVRYRADHIRLEVTDDGAGATDTQVGASTGHGFVGMRERVELYNGSLQVGPRLGGGFRVAATIPFDHEPAVTGS